ncbi:MAG: biopolymer transporter ExbD [Planctomycetota bacterium]
MRRWQRGRTATGEIVLNVIPLIDVVFFLLVFYVMASSFLREETVPIDRPASAAAQPAEAGFVSVAVARDGSVHCGGPTTLAALPAAMRSELQRQATNRCVVIADGTVSVQSILQVMDACRAGGATSVDIAATGTTP